MFCDIMRLVNKRLLTYRLVLVFVSLFFLGSNNAPYSYLYTTAFPFIRERSSSSTSVPPASTPRPFSSTTATTLTALRNSITPATTAQLPQKKSAPLSDPATKKRKLNYGTTVTTVLQRSRLPHVFILQPVNIGTMSKTYKHCESVDFSKNEVPYEPEVWTMSGLMRFSQQVHQTHGGIVDYKQAKWYIHDLENSRSAITHPFSVLSGCVAIRMHASPTTIKGGVCQCLQNFPPDEYCSAYQAYSGLMHCYDSMAKAVNTAILCPILTSPDFGIALSYATKQLLANSPSLLKLELSNNFPNIDSPDVVSAEAQQNESPTYYLIYKSLQRLIRLSDTYLFCRPDTAPHSDIEGFTLLPLWTTTNIFFIHDDVNAPLPISVLAKYTPNYALYEPPDLARWLFVIRNGRTTLEGHFEGLARMARRHFLSPQENVHEGYNFLASHMDIKVIARAIMDDIKKTPALRLVHVTFAGYGTLGSGLAAILISRLSDILAANSATTNQQLPSFQYNLVTFGAGPVGDSAFTDSLRSRVTIRNIASTYGSTAPCETVWSCDSPSNQQGTKSQERTISYFAPFPGRVEIDVQKFPNAEWKQSTTRFRAAANSVCAVPCWLSTVFCADASPHCTSADCSAFHNTTLPGQ